MKKPPSDEQIETLTDHLTELRKRLIYVIIIVVCGAIAGLFFTDDIFNLIRSPVMPYLGNTDGGLVFTGVMDKFVAHIKVGLLAGVLVTAPLWLYQVWQFVAPGLYRNEKKYLLAFLLSGTGLFVSGFLFCYRYVLPLAFDFLFKFGGDLDRPMITIGEYVSFFALTSVLFGLCFELPLIFVVLAMLGLVDKKMLREKRRFAIVGMAVVAALVTPPDVLSMTMMLIPLWSLYEISIFLVGWVEKKRAI